METIASIKPEELERLQDLRHFMYQNGPDHFEMQDWFSTPDADGDRENTSLRNLLKEPQAFTMCGYAACLAGSMALVAANRGDAPSTKGASNDMAAEMAEYMGMRTAFGHSFQWFFVGQWPSWAFDIRSRMLDLEPEDADSNDINRVDFQVVMTVLDQFISRKRDNWFEEVLPPEGEWFTWTPADTIRVLRNENRRLMHKLLRQPQFKYNVRGEGGDVEAAFIWKQAAEMFVQSGDRGYYALEVRS